MLNGLRNLWRTQVLKKPPKSKFARMNVPWKSDGELSSREYGSYEEYRQHQMSKLSMLNLENYDQQFRERLRERLAQLPFLTRGSSVLCLAARIGTECKAFIDRGCFTIGVDLNPGDENRYVVHGDFHQLQFADSSIDCIYTNALDHAFDLGRICQEVSRVLKPHGVFIAEIVAGTSDPAGRGPGKFEALWWESLESVAAQISTHGFSVRQRQVIEYPWRGEQFVFDCLKDASVEEFAEMDHAAVS